MRKEKGMKRKEANYITEIAAKFVWELSHAH